MPEAAVKNLAQNPTQLRILDISREDFLADNSITDTINTSSNEKGPEISQEHSLSTSKTYTIGLPDNDQAQLFALFKDKSLLTEGSVINFDTFESYPIKIVEIRDSQNDNEYVIEFRAPSSIKTFQADATTDQLLLLTGRLQNCVHYYLMESNDLAIEAKKSFEGIFRNLAKFSDVGEFLASDRQAAFK